MQKKTENKGHPGGLRDAQGYLPLENYGAIGDGRSVAISGADGSIDWWCVPAIDASPLFDRMLDPHSGGYFSITPVDEYQVERHYRYESNVLESVFTTATGQATLVESHNSGTAGRLPWSELARRLEGNAGEVRFDIKIRFSRRADTVNPYFSRVGQHATFHADKVLGLFLYSSSVEIKRLEDTGIDACITVLENARATMAIVAGEAEPLVVPSIDDISARIDISDKAWQAWSEKIRYDGPRRDLLVRSALALKFLLYSPSGAIAAAATTSLPERLGGDKNYDYRYAWIRDASYTVTSFLAIGAQEEAKAAFTWLLEQVQLHGVQVMYRLAGGLAPDVKTLDVAGYSGAQPVRTGNVATGQRQHGVYGDIFETAARFVALGNILDARSAETLSRLADECADSWRLKDAGIWELEELQHYTNSKISAWQALDRAVELADGAQLPTTCRDRWVRERDRIREWINTHCWSDEKQAYVMYPDSAKLDASLALAVRFRFVEDERLRSTVDAIDRELGAGPYHYRYSGVDEEEGCFLACSFWMIEAHALFGRQAKAEKAFDALMEALNGGQARNPAANVGIYSEMADPKTGGYLGNLPQGLTHLALIQTVLLLNDIDSKGT